MTSCHDSAESACTKSRRSLVQWRTLRDDGPMQHPGKIVYVDGNSGRTLSVDDAERVPRAQRFAATPRGPVPVVRVVSAVCGNQQLLHAYGPDGELLRSTVQRRQD